MAVRKSARWRYWSFALTGLLALSACGALKVEKTGKGVGIPEPGGFEQEEPGALPPGWKILGSHTARLELDEEISRSGKPSIRLSSRAEEKVTAIHRVESQHEAEGMVQIRASIKVGKGVANMWARLEGEEWSLADMPKILGPRDWSNYLLVLYARRESKGLSLLLEMDGPGTVWVDDLTIENKKLGVGGAKAESFSPMTLPNLDLEDADGKGRIALWSLSQESEPGMELRADRETFHSGSQSARIRPPVPDKERTARSAPSTAHLPSLSSTGSSDYRDGYGRIYGPITILGFCG